MELLEIVTNINHLQNEIILDSILFETNKTVLKLQQHNLDIGALKEIISDIKIDLDNFKNDDEINKIHSKIETIYNSPIDNNKLLISFKKKIHNLVISIQNNIDARFPINNNINNILKIFDPVQLKRKNMIIMDMR
jgi:hypothetical protein